MTTRITQPQFTEEQAKAMTEHPDFWVSYQSIKRMFEFLEESYECNITLDAKQRAMRLLEFWGDRQP